MKYLLLFATILLTAACYNCDDIHHDIDDSDALPYKKGTRLIFKSDLNNYDTLVIDYVADTTFFQRQPEMYCFSGHQDFYEQQRIYYIHKKKFTCDTPYILLRGSSRVGHAGLVKNIKSSFRVNDFYINDTIYDEVRYVAYGREVGGDTLRSYAFNPKDGIIFFEKNNGEMFYFLKYQ